MPYVPGNAVDGYCAVCKTDTVQTVLEVEGLQVRSVRCGKCSSEGPLRIARERTKAGLRAVARKRKPAAAQKRTRRKPEDPAQVFRRLLEGKEILQIQKYSIKAEYEVGQVLRHPQFGVGVVTAVTEPTKVSVTFEDGSRVMVCNRR